MGVENTKEDIWPNKRTNGYRIQTNDELHVMYRKQNTVTIIKVRGLQ
jgi:hypothetical protein